MHDIIFQIVPSKFFIFHILPELSYTAANRLEMSKNLKHHRFSMFLILNKYLFTKSNLSEEKLFFGSFWHHQKGLHPVLFLIYEFMNILFLWETLWRPIWDQHVELHWRPWHASSETEMQDWSPIRDWHALSETYIHAK